MKDIKDEQLFFKPFKDDKSVIGSVKDVKDIINFCSLVLQNKIPDVDSETINLLFQSHMELKKNIDYS